MSIKDRFLGTGTVESIFLAAIFAWTLATGFAMVQPEGHLANGVVEIYSLTSVASAPSA
jgi:hypothetical protein